MARSVTVSAVPSSARSLVLSGSLPSTRKNAQVRIAAQIAPERMPSLASASWLPLSEIEAISSATVNPIPATRPAPVTAPQPTGGDSLPFDSRLATQTVPPVPIGLPTR